ncbi:MAG: sulfatase [Acidobacteriota bacterium]
MSEKSFAQRLALWGANALAFWTAEIVLAVDPADSEPWPLLAAALVLHLSLALSAGLAFEAARRLPGLARLGPAEAALAFVPGLVLLAPKALQALRLDAAGALPWLAAAFLSGALWLLAERAGSRGQRLGEPRYLLLAFAWWLLALRLKDVARVAETHSSQIALGVFAAAALALLAHGAAWLAAAGARLEIPQRAAAALSAAIAAGLIAWRLTAAPPYDLDVEPAAERLGRGTPVILIVLDTTRADHLSLYGYPRNTSPQLERFAEDAVVFDHAVSTSSWTLPSHASLFTGLMPLSHGALRLPGLEEEKGELEQQGIHRPAFPLPEDVPTFAEHLRGFDFETAAIVANYAYLDPAFGVDRGYETYFSVRNAPVEPRILHLIDRRIRPLPWARRHWQVYRSADQINRLALRWLEAQENHRFLLFLNYMEPHLPWGPHQPGLRYGDFAAEAGLPERPRGTLAPDESWRRRVDLYDSNIASLDARLGELFERLREIGLYDRSLIVVTSDHGESFGENGVDGHGKSLNEAEVWVPLLIKYPGSRETGRRSERVQLVDLVPTLAAELGRPFPGDLEGRDLASGEDRPLDPADPRTWRLAEMYGDPTDRTGAFEGYQVAFYDGARKLLVRGDGSALFFTADSGFENPVPVPLELEAWADERSRELLERRLLMERRAVSNQQELELDPEVQKSLEALGYI